MLTTIIHTKATIQSILSGAPDGIERKYILNFKRTARLDSLVTLASTISQNGKKPFIEVKFQSKYTDRDKRLEVVSISDKICEIYKFSSFKRFDKDALEMDRISKELAELFPDFGQFIPSLVFDNEEKIEFIKESIHGMELNINILLI